MRITIKLINPIVLLVLNVLAQVVQAQTLPATVSNYLTLPNTPSNYSSIAFPAHFNAALNQLDNTPNNPATTSLP